MKRAIQFAGVVWLGIAAYADQARTKEPPDPKPPSSAAAKVEPPKGGGGGVPKGAGGVPKGAARIPNPGNNPIDRLLRMSPEARERALEKLPPQQQANLRRKFADFDKLSDVQKQRRLEPLNALWDLPPDKRQLVTKQIMAFNELPDDRKIAVKAAYVRLSKETPEGRADILARPQFQRRFSADELQILTVLPEYWPAPAAQRQTNPGK